jgi:hypothetical protein
MAIRAAVIGCGKSCFFLNNFNRPGQPWSMHQLGTP